MDIVNTLKIVQVDDQRRDRPAAGRCPSGAPQNGVEVSASYELGERVNTFALISL